jgi:hypothetical protein
LALPLDVFLSDPAPPLVARIYFIGERKMTNRLSCALAYLRKMAAALVVSVSVLLIGIGLAAFVSPPTEHWDSSHILAIIVGIGLLPAALALWTYPQRANLFGVPLIVLPIALPAAEAIGRYLYPDLSAGTADLSSGWFFGSGILWLVPMAAGACMLLWPLRSLWHRGSTAGADDLRRWLIPLGLLVVGALAFQGLLSLFAPALDSPSGQRGAYATAVIGERSVEVVLGMTPEQSAANARQLCPGCEFFGPEPGRCIGYINFWFYRGLYSIAQNVTDAEVGSITRCIARFASESCRLVQSKCAKD